MLNVKLLVNKIDQKVKSKKDGGDTNPKGSKRFYNIIVTVAVKFEVSEAA